MAETSITSGVFTKKLTNGTWTVQSSWGLTEISLVLTSGAATINGNTYAAGEGSSAIDMVVNIPVTFVASSQYPLSGIVVTASAGTVQIIASK